MKTKAIHQNKEGRRVSGKSMPALPQRGDRK
jgi:hypothetical protein